MSPGSLARKASVNRGRAFSEPSLFLWPRVIRQTMSAKADRVPDAVQRLRTPLADLCALALRRQAAYWGAIARVSRRLRSSSPLESQLESPPELPPETPSEPILTLPGALTAYIALLAVIHLCGCCCRSISTILVHPDVRLHSEALQFDAAGDPASGRRRRQGLELRHLFAAARQSQPYRFQRAVAVAVRQRAGAPFRRNQVFRCSWR